MNGIKEITLIRIGAQSSRNHAADSSDYLPRRPDKRLAKQMKVRASHIRQGSRQFIFG